MITSSGSHASPISYTSNESLSLFNFVKYELELWRELVCDFIKAKSKTPSEQWIVMGNSIGGLLTLMVTEQLQDEGKVGKRGQSLRWSSL